MKKLFLFILSLGILLPLSSFAFKADGGENLNITSPVNGDYYVAGGTLNLNTNVDGDLSAIGGRVFINGNIQQDLMIFGGEQYINSNILESVRAIGGKINFDGTVAKDLLAAGGEIYINEKSVIRGETRLAAGKITLAGSTNNVNLAAGEINLKGIINGNATIRAEKISYDPNSKILGDLYYESSKQDTGFEQIAAGKVTFKQVNYHRGELRAGFYGLISGLVLMKFIFLFGLGLILLFVGKKRINPSIETVKKYPRESLGLGVAAYLGLPIAAIILAMTVIGLPFAFVAAGIFVTIIIFAKLLNVYFYTHLLIQKLGGYEKMKNWKKIGILLGCSILSGILNGIDMIFAFFALGAIIRTHIIKKK